MPRTQESAIDTGRMQRRVGRAGVRPPRVLNDLVRGAGVAFNGDRPWDIRVHDGRFYQRVLRHGALGFGEAYIDGLWDAEQLDETITRLLRAGVDRRIHGVARWRFVMEVARQTLFNRQSEKRSFQVGERHYDIGDDIYRAMLGDSMCYSCAYWKEAGGLDQAQQAKMRLICDKLLLEPGLHLLDIGCGWGGLARYAAEAYGVRVTGVTVSRHQAEFARELCKGLPVEVSLTDYRAIEGQYDRVVSVGMFEHVGAKNYAAYFATIARVLADEGLVLLHTIGNHVTTPFTDPWIERYIFPNGKIPSARELTAAIEPYLVLEDWHNFGPDYDPTLMAWWRNFDAAWPGLASRYGERFYRMWKYYLHCSAGFFRSRQGQLWQLVLSRRGRRGVYRSIR